MDRKMDLWLIFLSVIFLSYSQDAKEAFKLGAIPPAMFLAFLFNAAFRGGTPSLGSEYGGFTTGLPTLDKNCAPAGADGYWAIGRLFFCEDSFRRL
ncbi:MAG: hypothetical protein ABSG68_01665 [Thermoguttaceae bacterium]|jgi:hypothetical protein